MQRKQIITTLAVGVLFASTSAGAATLSFDFTLDNPASNPGTGFISFETADDGLDNSYAYDDVTNFQASFSFGSNTWSEDDIFFKFNPNSLSFDLNGDVGSRSIVFDDYSNVSFDTDIVGFTNSFGNTLAFSENDNIIPNLSLDLYSINGLPTGSFTGIETSPVPVPAAIWLFGSALIGVVGSRRKTTKA